jgi:hypothetical protein
LSLYQLHRYGPAGQQSWSLIFSCRIGCLVLSLGVRSPSFPLLFYHASAGQFHVRIAEENHQIWDVHDTSYNILFSSPPAFCNFFAFVRGCNFSSI